MSDLLLDFLEGHGRNDRGLRYGELLKKKVPELINQVEYLEWMFPHCQPTISTHGGPVLADDEVNVVKKNDRMQRNLRDALDRMGRFYDKEYHWLVWDHPNHLGVTHIIRSVQLVLTHAEALAFYNVVMNHAKGVVSIQTIVYWKRAVGILP